MLALGSLSSPALADSGVWLSTESRVPIVRTERPALPRLDARVSTETFLMREAEGLAQARFRTGAVLYVASWAFIAGQGAVAASRSADRYVQEGQLELEPNLTLSLGDFSLASRTRLIHGTAGQQPWWRAREQLRLSYGASGAKLKPFLSEEVFVELSERQRMNQNRAAVGLGFALNPTTRLDVGYLLRSTERPSGWEQAHVLTVHVALDVPPGWP